MDSIGARQILEALVQGFDPSTGSQLPEGTVVQRAEVMRALLAGIGALDADLKRTRRRAQLPENVGRPWRTDEEARLVAAFRAGETLSAIAERHSRTVAAIEARLERLGLIAPEQRTTRNRYVTRTEARADAPAGPAVSETRPPSEGRPSPEPRSSSEARLTSEARPTSEARSASTARPTADPPESRPTSGAPAPQRPKPGGRP